MTAKIVDISGSGEERKLPPMQRLFRVEYRDPDTGFVHSGEFQVKRMTLEDIRRMELRRVELNGGLADDLLPDSVRFLNAMMAHLECALVKYPDWWKPHEFYSGDLIAEVYGEVMKFEGMFRGVDGLEPSGASGDSPESNGQADPPSA